MEQSEQGDTRTALLKELGTYASASFVARAARLDSDAQIRQTIAAAKDQQAFYRDAGVEDVSQAKG